MVNKKWFFRFIGLVLFGFVLAFSFFTANSTKANNIFIFSNNLSLGMVHPDVLQLQKFLNTHGYVITTAGSGSSGHETNKFGRLTKVALIKFQTANKIIPAKGNFGLTTREAVNKIISVPVVSSPLATPSTCKPGDLFSTSTGSPCNTAGVDNAALLKNIVKIPFYPLGCNSYSGFSAADGLKCYRGFGYSDNVVTLSSAKQITSFTIPNQTGDTVTTNQNITIVMPYGTDVTNLTPAISVSANATISPASGTTEDFTNPVAYTVTAQDSTTQVYTVTVNKTLNSAKAVTSFDFDEFTPAVTGTVTENDHTIALTVPFGTNVTNLTPTVTVSPDATISPASGTAEDFTNPVAYTVTAQDSTTQVYTVTVNKTLNSAKAVTSFDFDEFTPAVTGTVTENDHTIALTVPFGTNVTNLTPTVTVSPDATISPASGTAEDFTNPVTYTVTAQDGTTQAYTVTVTVSSIFVDARDSQQYPVVQIGTQTWMAKNLNVGTMVTDFSGCVVYTQHDTSCQVNDNLIEKFCDQDDASYCPIFGGLYEQAEALGLPHKCNDASYTCDGTTCSAADSSCNYPDPASTPRQGICPTGWHVPSSSEFFTLFNYLAVDGQGGAGTSPSNKLRAFGDGSHWNSPNTGATNSSGFNALGDDDETYARGYYSHNYSTGPDFYDFSRTDFWSSTSFGTSKAWWSWYFQINETGYFRDDNPKTYGFAIRCIKN